jgi:hypothetical protein
MSKDDVIRMARQAGLNPIYSACDEPDVSYAYEDWDEEIEKFAALIAAHVMQSKSAWDDGYASGVAAERKACAKVCDKLWNAAECAEAIRARSAL